MRASCGQAFTLVQGAVPCSGCGAQRSRQQARGMRTAVLLLALLGAGVAQAIRFGALPTSLGPGRISSNSSGDDGTDNRGKHCRPSQVHIALSEDEDAVRLVWSTRGESCETSVSYARGAPGDALRANATHALQGASQATAAASQARTQAQVVSADDDTQWFTQEGDSYLLTERQMCSGRARRKRFSKTFHAVTLTGLAPDTQYRYRIAGDSALHTFVSRPRAGRRADVTFVAFGDMGYEGGRKTPMASPTMDAIMREHQASPLDLVLHVGDLAYADGRDKGWDEFMAMVEPLASEVPYMVAIGNHEYAYEGPADNDPSGVPEPYRPDWGNFGDESGGECGAMFAHHFLMPSPSGAVMRRMAAAAARTRSEHAVPAAAAMAATAVTTAVAGGRRLAAAAAAAANPSLLPSAAAAAGGAAAPSLATAATPAATTAATAPARQQQGGDPGRPAPPPDNAPFWYSFDYGVVHFTILSSEHDLSPSSAQHQWLQADLASVDRCVTPWLVVASHRPMYVVYPHKSNRDVGEHLREYLEDLLLEYRVDLVLSGHVHSYYRSCSVQQEVCTDDGSGMVHLVIGTGGHVLSEVDEEQRLWCRAAATDAGFGLFRVQGEHLRMQFIRSADGQVVDEVKLYSQVPRDECTAYNLRRRAPGAPATGSTPAASSAAGDGGDGAGKGARKGESKAHKAARKAMHAVAVVDVPEADGGVRDDGEHSDDGSNDRR